MVDGYTLAFAALLLSAGVAGDRFGPRRMFLAGLALFTAASAGCALAPALGVLVVIRLNTARQVGGALGVAVAGSLVSGAMGFVPGLHVALAVCGARSCSAPSSPRPPWTGVGHWPPGGGPTSATPLATREAG